MEDLVGFMCSTAGFLSLNYLQNLESGNERIHVVIVMADQNQRVVNN